MTELEKAAAKEHAENKVGAHWEKANQFYYDKGGVNPSAHKIGFVGGFLESKEYWQSLPEPSLEEIKERFLKQFAGKFKHVDDADYYKSIFEFFAPFIKGDAVELQSLLNGSFGVMCNANDFFNYACAECVIIDPLDLKWVLPIFKKYGHSGLDACMSYIAKKKPIKPHITEEFEKAYKELENLSPKVYSEY